MGGQQSRARLRPTWPDAANAAPLLQPQPAPPPPPPPSHVARRCHRRDRRPRPQTDLKTKIYGSCRRHALPLAHLGRQHAGQFDGQQLGAGAAGGRSGGRGRLVLVLGGDLGRGWCGRRPTVVPALRTHQRPGQTPTVVQLISLTEATPLADAGNPSPRRPALNTRSLKIDTAPPRPAPENKQIHKCRNTQAQPQQPKAMPNSYHDHRPLNQHLISSFSKPSI